MAGIATVGIVACSPQSDQNKAAVQAPAATTFVPPTTTVFNGFPSDTVHHPMPTCGPVDSVRIANLDPDAAAWNTWNIPEFQDTQRFVAGQSQHYGPVACVAARQGLETLNSKFVDSVPVLVAVVWVDPGKLTAAYNGLNLHNGFNCVFVERRSAGSAPLTASIPSLGNATGKADTRWKGYVTRSQDRVCEKPSPSTRLNAVALMAADPSSDAAYPPVARFMILGSWKPAIGVRCGAAWCVVGANGSSDLPAPAHAARVAGSTGPRRTMMVVPGWYDEQQLAIPGGGGTPDIQAALKASIVPDPLLDTLSIPSFESDFVRVATITFEVNPSAKYLDKWQFRLGSLGPDTLYLRHVTAGTPHWVARVNHGSRYFPVIRTPHEGAHVTGTARWSWSDGDELIWVRCADGCCLVDDDWSSTFTELPPVFRPARSTAGPG